ncbi:hypothetical protein [Actinospica robiniae]|uniref:hypothetical protein n=1 Tax=Actinospica robiniae TaxID=304901 RepID=UPI0004244339|nr:hypothetical protein [Actinospica robiniae]
MTLVEKYEIAIPPERSTGGLRAPGAGHFIIEVTNRVQHDDTPIYAGTDGLTVAVKEVRGACVAAAGHVPGVPGAAFPRSLYPLPGMAVERERVRCAGGRADGRYFSHLLGQELLIVEALDGSDSSKYRRTGQADADGAAIYEETAE